MGCLLAEVRLDRSNSRRCLSRLRRRALSTACVDDHAEPRACLFTVLPGKSRSAIVSSWKRFTARKANSDIGRTGAFWQDDYWDRFIRNEDHFAATESYIDLNPVKAGLGEETRLWPWGRARLR